MMPASWSIHRMIVMCILSLDLTERARYSRPTGLSGTRKFVNDSKVPILVGSWSEEMAGGEVCKWPVNAFSISELNLDGERKRL